MDSEQSRLVADIYGRVQGVGFRYSAVERAEAMNIVGTVQNCWDGSVHVVAEGRRLQLETFLSWLEQGPMMAHVTRVDHEWRSPTGEFNHFEVI